MGSLLLVLLLLATFLIGLVLVPLGLPGLWVMVLGLIGYGWLTGFQSVGVWTMGIALGLAGLGEVIESWVGYRYTRRYGGSKRAGWGALLGGILGALVGVPVPVVGSVIGSFLGSFLGAMLAEYSSTRRSDGALVVGWGAVLGRAWATAAKTALGVVIAVVGLFAVFRG
ncbi:MAG: DUF456 family protein [Gemmatimonadales bacterium]